MEVTSLVSQIIVHTPFWVWVLFVYLIKRGISLTKDGPTYIPKSCIMPGIFIVWGLERVFTVFNYPIASFATYAFSVCTGAFVGFVLYSKTEAYYLKSNQLYRKGSVVPLIVIMTNFMVKYCLNVAIHVQPQLIQWIYFNIGYSVISGFSVGLFIGGIINTTRHKNMLEAHCKIHSQQNM